jgi:RNA polymerase sigma factor (sigma-70 family)
VWNDRRLVRGAARGDQDAFATIFRRYEQDLYRYCVAIVGDRQDAQDALQNTMVKALRALPGERREIELKPWLYRVAHNESIELRRRARPSEPLAEELSPPVASLEETAAERVRLRDLLADIAELSERHRGALVMRELGGLDFDEIGAALETSPGAARQVLYEARRGLQQMSDGREMRCDAVTALLSDGDGRVARRRDVRAHLRDCSECRGFAEGIRARTETLAGIAPLPALAAAAIAKGALAGGGSAAAGAGSAGGTGAAGTAGGAAGLAGGAAKVASTAAILKSTAAIVAVVGVGAVAVDHSHLLHGGGSSGGATEPAGAVAKPDSGVSTAGSPNARRTTAGPARRYFRARAVQEVGLKAPKARGAHDETASVARPQAGAADPTRGGPATAAATPVAKPEPGVPGVAPAGEPQESDPSATRPKPPAPPAHPERPSHPEPPASPSHPEHPAHPEHPVHPEHPTHPAHPEHPAQPEHLTHPPQASHPPHPEHPSHPSHPAHPTGGPPEESKPEPEPASPPEAGHGHEASADPESGDEAPEAEAPAPEADEAAAHPTPPAEPPGQAKK